METKNNLTRELCRRGIFIAPIWNLPNILKLWIPFYLWKRKSNGGTETSAYSHRETPRAPRTAESTKPQTLPRALRSIQSFCTAQTSPSCFPSVSLSSPLVAWGWEISCLRAGWEWEGAWPSTAAIPPGTEENFRPAENFARSQTSLQQLPIATETRRSPPLWCSTRTRMNLLLKARSRKSPGVRAWLFY